MIIWNKPDFGVIISHVVKRMPTMRKARSEKRKPFAYD